MFHLPDIRVFIPSNSMCSKPYKELQCRKTELKIHKHSNSAYKGKTTFSYSEFTHFTETLFAVLCTSLSSMFISCCYTPYNAVINN